MLTVHVSGLRPSSIPEKIVERKVYQNENQNELHEMIHQKRSKDCPRDRVILLRADWTGRVISDFEEIDRFPFISTNWAIDL